MKPLRTALKLPRYCRRKPLKNGRWAYFFEPPTWARKQECPLEAEALGQNYDGAVSRADRSARQLRTYAKRTRKQLVSGAQKRRAERTKPAGLSE